MKYFLEYPWARRSIGIDLGAQSATAPQWAPNVTGDFSERKFTRWVQGSNPEVRSQALNRVAIKANLHSKAVQVLINTHRDIYIVMYSVVYSVMTFAMRLFTCS